MLVFAGNMDQFMLGYSFIKLPLNDSICRLSVGVPGIIELDLVEVHPEMI